MNNPSLKSFKQQGVVLFIALIALVVMSLAAVALIRSVDTNTVIAGNLTFKQSALISSDRAVETALAWMKIKATTPADLYKDSAADGYYATYLAPNLDDPAVLKSDATWGAAASAVATGTGITGGIEDDSKNNIRFIVQRMCREKQPLNPGKPDNVGTQRCLFSGTDAPTCHNANDPNCIPIQTQSPMYRITVRVTGPKNTVSFSQTFVY
jgi:Tfp pilus assembly protein PilX